MVKVDFTGFPPDVTDPTPAAPSRVPEFRGTLKGTALLHAIAFSIMTVVLSGVGSSPLLAQQTPSASYDAPDA